MQGRSAQLIGIVLSFLLAFTMLSTAGLQSAYADEPAERPATTGGDAALEEGAETVPAATQREDGMYVADGLVYAATDGSLTLVGFDGLPEGEDAAKDMVVPAAVSADGKDMPVVAVDIAEGQTAEGVVALTLPPSINNVNTATLAAAFPNLASIDIASPKASAPVAAGAAAMRAAYSSFGGVLYRNAWVAADGDASQTTLTKELVWAPPATVVARIPVECNSIAAGAFADAKDLKTVVCFGVMGEIPQAKKAEDGTVVPGAFTDEQIQTVNVIVPQTGTVVPDGGRVSADVAVTDHSTMDVKREAWWKSGFASDRITLGEVCGSTTNTLPVTEEGVLKTAEAEVAYAPETTQNSSSRKAGIEPPESAIPTPVPDDDELDPSESGLVFTHLADMTLSVSWKGDPTATPSHLDIPAYATINGVTYPVTEIASNAFKGAVFLTSITIPETIKTIGKDAFEGCTNLSELNLPSALRTMANAITVESSAPLASSEEYGMNQPAPPQPTVGLSSANDSVSSYSAAGNGAILFRSNVTLKFTDLSVSNDEWSIRQNSVTSVAVTFSGANYFVFSNSSIDDPGTSKEKLTIVVLAFNSAGSMISSTSIYVNPPEGYRVAGAGSFNTAGQRWLSSTESALLDSGSDIFVTFVPTTAFSANNHITAAVQELDNFYNKIQADERYALASGNATQSWVNENFLTKAATDLDNFYDKAAFNTISYAGLEDASYTGALPTFYVDDAAKRPTVPEPRRDGYAFKGWTWGGSTSPSKDPSAAFSSGGPVTLTAVWEEAEPDVSEAKHFFTSERPLRHDDASERQTHVIKVRLSNAPRTLASVSFEGDDRTKLLKDTSGVELYVGASEDVLASGTRLGWGGSTGSGWTCELSELGEGSYGVYVGISVPTSAIDEASVPVSYTDGSYVASLVKMNYVFA